MRVPGYLFKDRVTITPYLGDSAYGSTYGTPVNNVRCRVEAIVKRDMDVFRRAPANDNYVNSYRAFFPPDTVITAKSKVIHKGVTLIVTKVAPQDGLTPSHIEVGLS